MKELKKKCSFNIQVLEGVDPMSDVTLEEIKGGDCALNCTCNGVTNLSVCTCNLGTNWNLPPVKPNAALKAEILPGISFE